MLPIDETMTFAHAPEKVAALYAQESYAETRRRNYRAAEATCEVTGTVGEGFTVVTTMRAPASMIPAKYRKFVGDSVTVTETQTWGAQAADGSFAGTSDFSVKGVPASMNMSFTLSPAGQGSSMHMKGALTVNVPFLGGTLEKAAAPFVSQVCSREAASVNSALQA